MSNTLFSSLVTFITSLPNASFLMLGFKIVGIITIILYDIWSIVSFQELKKLNYNYQDEFNYVLFAIAYLQLLIGGMLFLYAVFLL